jgi:hypothetical protein
MHNRGRSVRPEIMSSGMSYQYASSLPRRTDRDEAPQEFAALIEILKGSRGYSAFPAASRRGPW